MIRNQAAKRARRSWGKGDRDRYASRLRIDRRRRALLKGFRRGKDKDAFREGVRWWF